MPIGICPLCGLEKNRIQSHIIPEGFYKQVYDGKHRAVKARQDTLNTNWIQKGIRSCLLCTDCDNGILGDWDGHSATFWNSPQGMPDIMPKKQLVIEGLNYNEFKLFQLSVLWRMAAAGWIAGGAKSLGPHFERIREIIRSGAAPDQKTYPIWGEALVDDRNNNEVCKEMLFYAGRQKLWGMVVDIAIFGGVAWHYVSSSHTDSRIPYNAFDPAGTLLLPRHSIHQYRPIVERIPAIIAAGKQGQ